MDAHSFDYDDHLQKNILLRGGEQVARASAGEILDSVDLNIAFGLEKLLNLEMLVMEIARRAADIEPLVRDPQSISAESIDKAFEFDVLYGIVDSETNELEKLVGSIRTDIANAQIKVSGEGPGSRVEDKLHAATGSLSQMQELISTIRRESAAIEKTIKPSHDKQGNSEDLGYENGHVSPHAAMQSEDQRHVLQMLQQSIASELDLQTKIFDSQSAVEDLKMKLHYAEQESYFLEESIEALYERMFAAENASQLFLGTSKELIGTITTIQLSPPEFLTLRNKVQRLEKWLRDSGSHPRWSLLSRGATEEEQSTAQSEISTFGNIISDLKLAISNAESRMQKAEARCTQLNQTNVQLNGELNSLKSQGSDRAGLLETKLKESDTQLEHARASVDAIVEQQGMLRSSMSDMEQMIEDLKEKYLKAETRAENAESKCSLLTDTNLELSEELSFLRGRVESLENSLHQAYQLKVSTAKDIGSKTKTITDLVAKLALERERLHVQIVTLTKKNRMLAKECKENEASLRKEATDVAKGEVRPSKATEEVALTSPTQTKVMPTGNPPQEEVEIDEVAPLDGESRGESTLETVRCIEPKVLNWKYILAAALALVAAVLVHQLFQSDDGVQQLLRRFVA